MVRFSIINGFNMSRVEQVATSIKREIEKGRLRKNDRLPSINDFSKKHTVARDTIEKAYGKLKLQGLITSVPGKGYFVLGKKEEKINVLLILNKLSTFKKEVYYSFMQTLGKKAKIDLQVHHYNINLCQEIIETNLGKYHYYAIMPHFDYNTKLSNILKILKLVPGQELIVLDKHIKGLNAKCTQIYQDFENDIYTALVSAVPYINKYRKLVIVMDKDAFHPLEILKGAEKFCIQFHKKLEVLCTLDNTKLSKGTVYIETSDSYLAQLLSTITESGLKPGKDIGIISFNETVLKEALGISVITTDFIAMGKTAASSILQNKTIHSKNPFYFIKRNSL